jgi:hypothetical protein
MRSSFCSFKNRLISLSICACAALALSAPLSASSTQFVLGNSTSETYLPNGEPIGAIAVPVGPYAGTLGGSSITLFFCLDGSLSSNWDTSYNGNDSAPSGTDEEEAAFLASLFLSDAAADGITLDTYPSNGDESLTETGPGLSTFVNTVQGPITMAIWEVMGSLPNDSPYYIMNPDPAAAGFVSMAQLNYSSFATSLDADVVFVPGTDNQSFVGAAIEVAVPEPGTLVLFGAGALLLALGTVRRLARRPR